jgi:hypothetical protein
MDGFDIGLGLDAGVVSGRDAAGRFVPGASGNPAGKRPGTRNRKTVLAEALRDGEDNAVARVVIDKAIGGDGVAARFLLGLISPKPRGRAIALDLPEGTRPGDVVAAFDATFAAMAAGEITPDALCYQGPRRTTSRSAGARAGAPARCGDDADAGFCRRGDGDGRRRCRRRYTE